MVMASSHPVAGDGVQHGAAEKTEANDDEENVEHEGLVISARSGATDRLGGIKVRYALAGRKIKIP
jgi:hypothetical protein